MKAGSTGRTLSGGCGPFAFQPLAELGAKPPAEPGNSDPLRGIMEHIEAVRDTLDGLSEEAQSAYSQGEDGLYYANIRGFERHPAALGLVGKNAELVREKRTLSERLRLFDGIEDPDAARAALAKVPELEQALEGAGSSAEKIRTIQQEHQTKLAAMRTEAERERASAEALVKAAEKRALDYFTRSEITKAITEAGGEPELLEHPVSKFIKAGVTESGEFTLAVLDHHGIERVKDGKGTPFTLPDLVGELKAHPKYGRGFNGSGNQGSGAAPSGGGGGRTFRSKADMEPADRVKYIQEHGREAYLSLPDKAA